MTELERVLMERDNMTREEAKQLILDAFMDIYNYTDVDEFMADWFGLEPDYIYNVTKVAGTKIKVGIA